MTVSFSCEICYYRSQITQRSPFSLKMTAISALLATTHFCELILRWYSSCLVKTSFSTSSAFVSGLWICAFFRNPNPSLNLSEIIKIGFSSGCQVCTKNYRPDFKAAKICLQKRRSIEVVFAFLADLYPSIPSVPFLGPWQTVKTQIRRRKSRRLIRVYAVSIHEFLLQIKQKLQITSITPQLEMDSSNYY